MPQVTDNSLTPLIDLPRAGHFMLLEQPEAVNRAVAEFVGADVGLRGRPLSKP